MTLRIKMHCYRFGARCFVALVNVGALLICSIPDIGHVLSGSDPDGTFSFTNVLLAAASAINAVNYVFSTAGEGRNVSFKSVTPTVCVGTTLGDPESKFSVDTVFFLTRCMVVVAGLSRDAWISGWERSLGCYQAIL